MLDNAEITGLIADRYLRILDLIEGKGRLPTGEANVLRAALDSWIKQARRLEAENETLREEYEELSEDDEDNDYEVKRLLRKINREVSFDFDDLGEAIDFLLEG